MQNPKQKTHAHVTASTSTQTPYPTFNPTPSHNNQFYHFPAPLTSSLNPNQDSNNGGLCVDVEKDFLDAFLDGDQDPKNEDVINADCVHVDHEVGTNGVETSRRKDEDEEENYIIGIKESEYFGALPSGFRFAPSDDELISEYLQKKINNIKLPHSLIKLVNLYRYTPYDLAELYPGIGERKWYFFTPRDRKYQNGSRPNRAAGTGYWKATGKDKPIWKKGTNNGPEIGYRKALVFYDGKPKEGIKTNWIMHEYRVADPQVRVRTSEKDMRLDDYVLCKIIKNADRTRKNSKVGPSAAVSNNSQENVPDSPLEANQNGLAESEIQAPQPLAAYPLSSVQNRMNYPSVPQEMNTYYPQNGFSNSLHNGFGYAAERDIQIPQQQQTDIYLSGYMPNPNLFINPVERNIQASKPTPESIFGSSYMANGMMYPMERNIQAPP